MKKRKTIILALMLIASMSLISAPQVTRAQTTIKIGGLGPLGIPVGVDMKNGLDLAVSEINSAGGVDVDGTAMDFEVTTETTSDSEGTPSATVAATNIQKMITEGVVAIIGGFRTEVVIGIEFTINQTLTPFLGVGSTAPIITDYYYRVGPPNGTTLFNNLMGLYGTYLVPKYNVTTVSVVREDQVWTDALLAGIQALAPAFGMTVDTTVAPIQVTASGSDVQTAMNALTTKDDIDAVLTLFSAPVGQHVTEAWSTLGLNEKMFLAGINVPAQDSEYYTNTGGAATGEIFTVNAPPGEEPTSKTSAFRTAYSNAYGEEPTYTAFAAYDSVYILKDAIERAGSATSADIHAELPNTDYLGAATHYKFTSESSAGQVASPAVPESLKIYTNATAHDLYTPSGFNPTYTAFVSGFPYSQLYYGQWTADGQVKAVWAGSDTGFDPALEPPYHAHEDDHEESDEGLFPAFEWYMVVIATFTYVITKKKRIKRRKY